MQVKEMYTEPQVTETKTEAGVMKEVGIETEVVSKIGVETRRVVSEIEVETVKEVAREMEEVMRESRVDMERKTVSRIGNGRKRERKIETVGAAVESTTEINIGTSTNINTRNLIAKDNRLSLSSLTCICDSVLEILYCELEILNMNRFNHSN